MEIAVGANGFDIAVIGCGNMGAALISGYTNRNASTRLLVVDPDVERSKAVLSDRPGVTFSATLEPLKREAAALTIIAVKPQSCAALLPDLAATEVGGGLVLSIVAGISADRLKKWLPNARIVRCMPNTPSMMGAGTSAIWCEAAVAEDERRLCRSLFEAVGTVEWLEEERLIDAVTAISGSGPAYVFAFTEALADAGTKIGLAPELAARLAIGTIRGAAAMLGTDSPPGRLKAAVRSPAGTTDAALRIFEAERAFDRLILQAVEAAHDKAQSI